MTACGHGDATAVRVWTPSEDTTRGDSRLVSLMSPSYSSCSCPCPQWLPVNRWTDSSSVHCLSLYTSFSSLLWKDVRLRFSFTLTNSGALRFSSCSFCCCFSSCNTGDTTRKLTGSASSRERTETPGWASHVPCVCVCVLPPLASCASSEAPPPEGRSYGGLQLPVSSV